MTPELAELPPRTSASQLVTWTMCPRKYACTYLHGFEPEFRSVALVFGSAMHATLGWWFAERLAGREPTIQAAEQTLEADLLAETIGANVRWKEQSPESVEADAKRLLRLYVAQFGDMPVATVEEPFTTELVHEETGEVLRPLRGYLDIRRDMGGIVELKTSSKGWDEHGLARHLQVGAYLHAEHARGVKRPTLEVHALVKLKREPRIETYTVSRTHAENRWWRTAASEIESAILSGHFPPKPSPLCRECEHQRACAEWTGHVASDRTERRPQLVVPAPAALTATATAPPPV